MSRVSFVAFNQEASCISVAFPFGFYIFNCDPFGRFYSSDAEESPSTNIPQNIQTDSNPIQGVSIVQMLFCTSLVAVVGNGNTPSSSQRRLVILNTKRQSAICELTFSSAILAVRLNRIRLLVLLEEHIYIYNISNMKLIHTIDTAPNPNALCALSSSSENCFLAYPPNLSSSPGDVLIFDLINLQAVNIIQAHKNALSSLSFSFDGSLLATSSDKGTIIRVFSIPNGDALYQFRRGTYNAHVYSLSFDPSNTFLCVSSDSDTIHIFKLTKEKNIAPVSQSSAATSPTSMIYSKLTNGVSAVSSFLPNSVTGIWEPQRHFAFCKLPPFSKGIFNICALSGSVDHLQLFVVSFSGVFYQYAIDMNGGECMQVKEYSILED